MRELYRGHHIFLAQDHDMREVIVPIVFPFDHIIEAKSAHGCSPGFANKEPKFLVKLGDDRKFWLMGKFSDFAQEWDDYLSDDDEPCDCPACTAEIPNPPISQN